MQARAPPINVILKSKQSVLTLWNTTTCKVDSHIGIDPRDMRLKECLRKGRQPTLRLPFLRIGTPQSGISIASSDSNKDKSVFGDEDLIQHGSIRCSDGSRKRHDDIFFRSAMYVKENPAQ